MAPATGCDRPTYDESLKDSQGDRVSPKTTAEEQMTPLRRTAHYALLVFASMVGTLIRVGLQALATYDGSVVFSLAWAQGVGCGIMGLALTKKSLLTSVYPPLYTAMATGVAGSVTTFSSWMLGGWQAFSDYDQYNRKGLHDTVDGLAYSFVTFGIGMAALRLGEHISYSLPPPNVRQVSHRRTSLLDALALLSAMLAYMLALILYFLAPHHWRHDVTFPLLLAPPGAMLRYALAALNNRASFPLGTFIANISATLILAGAFAASHSHLYPPNSAQRCNALNALQQGFCGCLSTVSTFCVESRTVQGARLKWGYVLGSVVLGHLCMLAVVGGVGWSRGGGLGQLCTV